MDTAKVLLLLLLLLWEAVCLLSEMKNQRYL